jgi:hypothetical protein
MQAPNIHPMERLLHRLSGVVSRHRGWFIYPQLVFFGVCLFYAGNELQFRTDPNEMFSSDQGYVRDWSEVQEEFQLQEDLVALVESEDFEKNRQFVERLAARLDQETNLFKNVFYKRDLRSLGSKGLLFLPEPKLDALRESLQDYEPLIRTFSQVSNLASLLSEVDTQMRTGAAEPVETHPLVKVVPALTRIVQQAVESTRRPGLPPSPGLTALFAAEGTPVPGDYLNFAGGRFYAVTCAVASKPLEEAAILRLRELVKETQLEVPGVNVGVTGQPVLRYEEMRQARGDTTKASLVALVVVALTFIFCYHEVRRPLMATASLVVGIGYTLGFATLTLGHLNILTITFVPILIGLAIDFGVHLITRYEEELRDGRSARAAIDKALVVSGTGICTGGLTTAAAFLAMTLTGFKGIREMGLVSGGGLLVCLVPMMTMLPAMLLYDKKRKRVAPSVRKALRSRREQLEQHWLGRPRLVVGVGLALSLLAGIQVFRVRFDYNLLNLQNQGLSAVAYERKMVESSSHTMLACLVPADTIDEALALEQKIRQLDTVAEVVTLAPMLAGDQEHKLADVRQIRELLGSIQFAPMDTGPADLAALDHSLEGFGHVVGSAIYFAGRAGNQVLREELMVLRDAVETLRAVIAAGPAEVRAGELASYQQALFADLATTLAALQQQDDRAPLRVNDLPSNLRSRFIGRTGKFLLQVYPRDNVWERGPQDDFVRELRTVAPKVTGAPVRFYEYTSRLKSNAQKAVVYALLAIVLMLVMHFRNVICALLALLPVGVGILWTLGWMGFLGIPFNPANIISFTLLIGIGVSNGVHILNRFTEENNPSVLGKSTGKAVLVSALTTAAGFGSLMLAEHAGIASLGQVMALGTTMCMLASLTVLPAVLLLLTRSGWKLAHGWISH